MNVNEVEKVAAEVDFVFSAVDMTKDEMAIEFNKDVAENIVSNTRAIQSIKDGNENIAKCLQDEKKSIDALAEAYVSSNEVLKKLVEKQDVNEEYIFEILDRWAEDRRVKASDFRHRRRFCKGRRAIF